MKRPSGKHSVCPECGKRVKAKGLGIHRAKKHGRAGKTEEGKRKTADGRRQTADGDGQIEAAVALLAEVIAARVAEQIMPRVEAQIAERIGRAAVTLAPAAVREASGADLAIAGIRRLNDGELRIAMSAARVAGEQGRWQKLVAEAKRRENAAAAIERESAAEG